MVILQKWQTSFLKYVSHTTTPSVINLVGNKGRGKNFLKNLNKEGDITYIDYEDTTYLSNFIQPKRKLILMSNTPISFPNLRVKYYIFNLEKFID
jgi:ribosomal protein S18